MCKRIFFLLASEKIYLQIPFGKRNVTSMENSIDHTSLNFVSRNNRIDLLPVSPAINYTPRSEIGHREAARSTNERKLRNAFPISGNILVQAWNHGALILLIIKKKMES